MKLNEIIGLIAGVITTSAFLPQVFKIFKTKKADDISYLMYFAFILGILLWLIYAFSIKAIPLIFANLVSLVFVLIIYFLKIYYRNKDL